MTSVVASADDLEREQAGETDLELVAVRYTGSQTLYNVEQHLTPVGWPGSAPLDGGPTPDANGAWELALVPDEALGHLEGRPDIEVVYADQRETFAHILLEETDLPENVFGRNADLDLQERVFDLLGLEPTAQGGPFEDQLREIAYPDSDAEPEDETAEDDDQSTVSTLVDEYSRSELGEICKELREDADAFNLRENAKKRERAEFIAGFDRQERSAAVDAALGGDD